MTNRTSSIFAAHGDYRCDKLFGAIQAGAMYAIIQSAGGFQIYFCIKANRQLAIVPESPIRAAISVDVYRRPQDSFSKSDEPLFRVAFDQILFFYAVSNALLIGQT
jgi:hypothetical protein